MRPSKLTLEGFTSFARRAEIDFAPLDLFAIVGPTGSGKTSILDAITWALYGRTTRLGKTAADLISHGEPKVAVDLEFTVGAARYRVARTAKRTGSPQVRLEYWDSGWAPGDASGVAETNEAICRIIGLDFDAFTRSIILPQGKFDAFLRGELKERREILKSMLGLEVYDRMRELAGLERNRLEARKAAAEDEINRLGPDCTDVHLKELKTRLRETKKRESEVARDLLLIDQLVVIAAELRRNRESLANKQVQLTGTQNEHLKASSDASREAATFEKLKREIAEAEKALKAVVIDENRFSTLLALKERAAALDRLEASRSTLETEFAAKQSELAAKREFHAQAQKSSTAAAAGLESAANALAQAREEYDQVAGNAGLIESLAKILQGLPARNDSLAKLQRELADLTGRLKKLQSDLPDLKEAVAVAQDALDQARAAHEQLIRDHTHRELKAGLKKGEPCPVCEQPVARLPKVPAGDSLEAAKRRVDEAEQARQKAQTKRISVESDLATLPGRLREFEARIQNDKASLEADQQSLSAFTGETNDAARLAALTRARNAIVEAKKKRDEAEGRFNQASSRAKTTADRAAELDKTVHGLTERVTQIAAQRKDLLTQIEQLSAELTRAGGRDAIQAELDAVNQLRAKRDQLSSQLEKQKKQLEAARADKARSDQQVAILEERLRGLNTEIETRNSAIGRGEQAWSISPVTAVLPPGGDEQDRAERKRAELDTERLRITAEISRLETEIEHLKNRIKQLKQLREQLEQVQAQLHIYDQLANALRADRFITYLLEAAYKDLCDRGSAHLQRFSQERYSFTSGRNEFYVRDAWNGDAERSAATLSGGESFLASLALALALGESVAALAAGGLPGARLNTLFLDEGVSTLDQDDTLPAVIEALTSLQAGDRMIGVISHMENLAERLPARIQLVPKNGKTEVTRPGEARAAGS